MAGTAELSERILSISMSATMQVAAAAEKMRLAGVDVADFGAGEPDFPTPDHIKQAAIRAIEENFTRYTSSAGTPELRQAVCDRHAADFGTAYRPSQCAISVGGKHTVFNLVQALINPGDEVIVPLPGWVTYAEVVKYAGGRCVFVETGEDTGFALTAAMIERRLTPRTRMVIINSPANPSGAVVDREELERIHHQTSRRGVWLLSDECYGRLLYHGAPCSAAALAGARDTVLVAGSLSKTYAMTGWRIGYALGPEAVIQAVIKLQSHSTSNPTSVAQKAAVAALSGPQDCVERMLAEYRRRRDFVVARLRRIPCVRCVEPGGAFYAYPNIGAALGRNGIGNTVEFAHRLLEEARVAVVPGEAFGTREHVRISFATSMEALERGIDRLARFMAELE